MSRSLIECQVWLLFVVPHTLQERSLVILTLRGNSKRPSIGPFGILLTLLVHCSPNFLSVAVKAVASREGILASNGKRDPRFHDYKLLTT